VVNQRLYVISGGPKPGGSFSNVNEMFEPRGQPTSRATPTQVGTIMALLATFDAAGLLPPQPSPEADRLIRILIQSQAALMKSNHPAVRRLLQDALTTKLADAAASAAERFRSDGWTSESLEAVVDYITTKPVWEDEQIEAGLRPYHIGRADLDFLSYTFQTARTRLAAAGHDVHAVYASRRREMPGGGL
jgi:hypothetical protein